MLRGSHTHPPLKTITNTNNNNKTNKQTIISSLSPSPDNNPPPPTPMTDQYPSPNHNIFVLPNSCLAHVFHFLGHGDRKQCSLVCKYWLHVEGQNRYRLSLNAQSELISFVKPVFNRFDAVTKLSLKCDRRLVSIGDDALVLISQCCENLIRLKLRSCKRVTDVGIECFVKNCRKLRKVSVGSCGFGAKGINAVVNNCLFLEELSVKRLHSIGNDNGNGNEGNKVEVIGTRVSGAGPSLRMISLKDMYNAQWFEPLIVGSKKLKTLRVVRCYGDWDKVLQGVGRNVDGLVELHLERVQVSDLGLGAVSGCRSLEILHLLKTPECSNLGLMSVAERCKVLRKVHVDGWKMRQINDEGLISVAKNCPNLQELVLISVDVTHIGLDLLAANCRKLERLALCESETVGDAEISCIAAKCMALRKLCIKSCPVSDYGMEALAVGCPNLVKVKVKKCKGVTSDGVGWLMASRRSLTVNLDATVVEHQIANVANDSRVLAVLAVDQDHLG